MAFPDLPRWTALLGLLTLLLHILGCEQSLAHSVSVSTISPQELDRLTSSPVQPLILDLRAQADHEAGHIPGAVPVRLVDIDGYLARRANAKEGEVVTVCYDGYQGLLAGAAVRANGIPRVRSLSGGMSGWRASNLRTEAGATLVAPELVAPNHVALTRFEQSIVFVSGLVIKPIYMLLALLTVIWLRRATERSLVWIRRGTLVFFVGEAFCTLDWAVHRYDFAYPIDFLHGAGMVVWGAMVPFGLFALVDDKVLRFAAAGERCAVQRFCGHCWKREPVRCAPHDVFLFVAPALALVALLPLTAPIFPRHTQSTVFGSVEDYGLPPINQLVEFRLYPIMAALSLVVAFVLLWGGPGSIRRAQVPFFVGLGFMGFSLLRFILNGVFHEALYWSDFWEELTELMTIVGVGVVIWFFRRQLGLTAPLPGGNATNPADSR